MVLVRRSELACRNGWDQDLWELAESAIDIQIAPTRVHIPVPGEALVDALADRSGLSDDEGEQHGTPEANKAGELFTDKIASIGMPLRSHLRNERASKSEDDASGVDQRSSAREGRRRRELQREIERKRRQESVLDEVSKLMDSTHPDDARDLRLLPNTDRNAEEHAERPRRRVKPAADEARGRQDAARTETEVAPIIEFSPKNDRFRSGSEKRTRARGETSSRTDESGAQPVEQRRPARHGTEQLPIEEVRARGKRDRPEDSTPVSEAAPAEHRRVGDGDRQRRDSKRQEQPPVEPRPARWLTVAGDPASASGPRLEGTSLPRETDPVDRCRSLEGVARCCATCRDFKQLGDGRRGWCDNPYAFAERRMVQSSDLACRSSIGVWWLPSDDVWLEHADTSHHGRPTPLLDEHIGMHTRDDVSMGERSQPGA